VATNLHPMWHANHKACAFKIDRSGWKLPASAVLEHLAKEFPKCVVGLQVPVSTPADHHEPMLKAHPDLDLISAAERCASWPTKLILDLWGDQNASGTPSASHDSVS
jgi:hypothetical protein